MYGMTVEQFWEGDPELVIAYRRLQELKNKQKNQELWIQGLYNYRALNAALSMFGEKGSKRVKYFEKPIDLDEPPKPEEATEEEKIKARESVVAWLDDFKRNWTKKQKEVANAGSND